MKNFDTERAKRLDVDRSFTIGGHTFTHKPSVAPEAVREWSAMVGGEHVLTGDDGKPVLGEPTPATDRDGNLLVRGGALVDYQENDGEKLTKVLRNAEVVTVPGQPISTLSEQQAIEILDTTVLAFLEPGQEDAWKSVRDPAAELPLNLQDLRDLVSFLFEVTSGRPTGRSSDSSGSPSGNGSSAPVTPLTAVSPSPAPVQAG